MYVYQFLSYNNRFEPAPVQVLLSEEITGSIRKLKVGLCFSCYDFGWCLFYETRNVSKFSLPLLVHI